MDTNVYEVLLLVFCCSISHSAASLSPLLLPPGQPLNTLTTAEPPDAEYQTAKMLATQRRIE